MEKQLSHLDAWANFWVWVNQPEQWAKVDRPGRDRIAKAQKRYLFKHPADLSYIGVKSLLEQYAPARYSFTETITLHE